MSSALFQEIPDQGITPTSAPLHRRQILYHWATGEAHTYTCIYSFSDSFPIQAITEYWAEFSVLYTRSLLFIYSIHSRLYFCSVSQSCLTLCDPINCSMPGFSVLHYLPKFDQTHARWVDDAIQPSHPLSPVYPPALILSQHQGLFQWVGLSNQGAKVLEPQHQSFQWKVRVDFI